MKRFPGTCVSPSGQFTYGIHKPSYTAINLRQNDYLFELGKDPDLMPVNNQTNFPQGDLDISAASWLFEIPNAFPFMGATFILKSSADAAVQKANPFARRKNLHYESEIQRLISEVPLDIIPHPMLLALAKTTTDPDILSRLATLSCGFDYDQETNVPKGLRYRKSEKGELRPDILDHRLFELVSNNPFLSDLFKRLMVLTPGAQGTSPIIGEYHTDTHIWEYLRQNSYIPWGHYAANMAQDAVRYQIGTLTPTDMTGLRHLYYQRVYMQLAISIGLNIPVRKRPLTSQELEDLRLTLVERIQSFKDSGRPLPYNATIWGQNFGFDLSPTGYRLNASHQQIHQQFALVPPFTPGIDAGLHREDFATYVPGDLISRFCRDFQKETASAFFPAYLQALRDNRRLDNRQDRTNKLIFYEDDNVILFVPKAQRSQGEIQIMTKPECGNIVEADGSLRASLDGAILSALRVLACLGAQMITCTELSKRFDDPRLGQRLLYCFLPKHPQSPGGFTEALQRWVVVHYPEDFAEACGRALEEIRKQEV
ncbi:MAG: hypothetical protein V1736_13620 [Pseudomonadota bacterium]